MVPLRTEQIQTFRPDPALPRRRRRGRDPPRRPRRRLHLHQPHAGPLRLPPSREVRHVPVSEVRQGRPSLPLRVPQRPSVGLAHPPLDLPGAVGVRLASGPRSPLWYRSKSSRQPSTSCSPPRTAPTSFRNERSVRQIRSRSSRLGLSRSALCRITSCRFCSSAHSFCARGLELPEPQPAPVLDILPKPCLGTPPSRHVEPLSAVRQCERDPNPREPLFRLGSCVALFAGDEREVRFCTHLEGMPRGSCPSTGARTRERATRPTRTASRPSTCGARCWPVGA